MGGEEDDTKPHIPVPKADPTAGFAPVDVSFSMTARAATGAPASLLHETTSLAHETANSNPQREQQKGPAAAKSNGYSSSTEDIVPASRPIASPPWGPALLAPQRRIPPPPPPTAAAVPESPAAAVSTIKGTERKSSGFVSLPGFAPPTPNLIIKSTPSVVSLASPATSHATPKHPTVNDSNRDGEIFHQEFCFSGFAAAKVAKSASPKSSTTATMSATTTYSDANEWVALVKGELSLETVYEMWNKLANENSEEEFRTKFMANGGSVEMLDFIHKVIKAMKTCVVGGYSLRKLIVALERVTLGKIGRFEYDYHGHLSKAEKYIVKNPLEFVTQDEDVTQWRSMFDGESFTLPMIYNTWINSGKNTDTVHKLCNDRRKNSPDTYQYIMRMIHILDISQHNFNMLSPALDEMWKANPTDPHCSFVRDVKMAIAKPTTRKSVAAAAAAAAAATRKFTAHTKVAAKAKPASPSDADFDKILDDSFLPLKTYVDLVTKKGTDWKEAIRQACGQKGLGKNSSRGWRLRHVVDTILANEDERYSRARLISVLEKIREGKSIQTFAGEVTSYMQLAKDILDGKASVPGSPSAAARLSVATNKHRSSLIGRSTSTGGEKYAAAQKPQTSPVPAATPPKKTPPTKKTPTPMETRSSAKRKPIPESVSSSSAKKRNLVTKSPPARAKPELRSSGLKKKTAPAEKATATTTSAKQARKSLPTRGSQASSNSGTKITLTVDRSRPLTREGRAKTGEANILTTPPPLHSANSSKSTLKRKKVDRDSMSPPRKRVVFGEKTPTAVTAGLSTPASAFKSPPARASGKADPDKDPKVFCNDGCLPVLKMYQYVTKCGLDAVKSAAPQNASSIIAVVTSIDDSLSRGHDLDSTVSALERVRGTDTFFDLDPYDWVQEARALLAQGSTESTPKTSPAASSRQSTTAISSPDKGNPWYFCNNSMAPLADVYQTFTAYGKEAMVAVLKQSKLDVGKASKVANVCKAIGESLARGYDMKLFFEALEAIRGQTSVYSFSAMIASACKDAEKALGFSGTTLGAAGTTRSSKKDQELSKRPARVTRASAGDAAAQSETAVAVEPAKPAVATEEPEQFDDSGEDDDIWGFCNDGFWSLTGVYETVSKYGEDEMKSVFQQRKVPSRSSRVLKLVRRINASVDNGYDLHLLIAQLESLRGDKSIYTFANKIEHACKEAENMIDEIRSERRSQSLDAKRPAKSRKTDELFSVAERMDL